MRAGPEMHLSRLCMFRDAKTPRDIPLIVARSEMIGNGRNRSMLDCIVVAGVRSLTTRFGMIAHLPLVAMLQKQLTVG